MSKHITTTILEPIFHGPTLVDSFIESFPAASCIHWKRNIRTQLQKIRYTIKEEEEERTQSNQVRNHETEL